MGSRFRSLWEGVGGWGRLKVQEGTPSSALAALRHAQLLGWPVHSMRVSLN